MCGSLATYTCSLCLRSVCRKHLGNGGGACCVALCGDTAFGKLGDCRCILEVGHSARQKHTDGNTRW